MFYFEQEKAAQIFKADIRSAMFVRKQLKVETIFYKRFQLKVNKLDFALKRQINCCDRKY